LTNGLSPLWITRSWVAIAALKTVVPTSPNVTASKTARVVRTVSRAAPPTTARKPTPACRRFQIANGTPLAAQGGAPTRALPASTAPWPPQTSSKIDTSTAGSHTFTVTATSKDGQSSSKLVAYQVIVPSSPPPPPSNRFVVKHVKARANGSVSFDVKVPGPGTINVLETAWKNNFATAATLLQPATGRFVFSRSQATPTRASTTDFKVKPNKRGRRLVAHHRYKVRTRLWVTYKPSGGSQRKVGVYGLRITR
jgi:hypothetical protein